METRRTFLKSAGLLAASLPLVRSNLFAGPEAKPHGAAGGMHPSRGLLFDAEDIPRIRENLATPRFAEIRAAVFPDAATMAANEKFLRDEIKINDHISDQSKARGLLERAAFAYALTGDERQFQLARLGLQRLMEFKRWDYFLEGGEQTIGIQRASETTMAFCLALDWLGEKLSGDERAKIEEQVATKGAPACYLMLYGLKYPDRVRGWAMDPAEGFPFKMDLSRWPLILNATNLKVIPTCGLGFAAITLHGRHPQAQRWLDMARQSAKAFSMMFGPDGAYDEGVGYWGYTAEHLVLFAETLYRRLGIDDRSLINYPGTVRYALVMSMPTEGAVAVNSNEKAGYNATPKGALDPSRGMVNFGDAGVAIDVSIAPWVGLTHDDPVSNYVAKNVGGVSQWPAAVWYRANAPIQAPEPELLDVRLSNDLVISRTGWTAADATVAFRSGGPSNHEHADRNSVIFKAYGERLFNDPFKASYIPTNPRWKLRLTAAHTAVLINGQGHQYHDGHEGTNSSWASAHVTNYAKGADWMVVTSDATDAYHLVLPAAQRVERTLVYLKPDILLVFDRVKLSDAPLPVQMRYQVFNEDGQGKPQASGATFGITRPGASLSAQVFASGGVGVATGRIDLPPEEGAYPFVEVTSAPALTHDVLAVCTAQKAGGAHGALAVTREQSGAWRIKGTHNARTVDVTLTAAGDEPPTVQVA